MSKKFTRLLTASALFCAAGVSGALAASPFELGMVIKSTTNPYYCESVGAAWRA
jgi:ABC-type sugar transport system substrate-binding protein